MSSDYRRETSQCIMATWLKVETSAALDDMDLIFGTRFMMRMATRSSLTPVSRLEHVPSETKAVLRSVDATRNGRVAFPIAPGAGTSECFLEHALRFVWLV